jgi:hypothetical protein
VVQPNQTGEAPFRSGIFWKPAEAGAGKSLPAIDFTRRPGYAQRMGTLYYGDNLEILRRYLKDETVDLVYLDPPFNSAQNYNAFFHDKGGTDAASQIRALTALGVCV